MYRTTPSLRHLKQWLVLLLFVLLTVTVGCGESGPATTTVKGKVSLDGKPLPRGSVLFNSTEEAASRARSNIQPDGTYELQAVPGEYKVIITYQTETDTTLDPDDPNYVAPESLLPANYSSLMRTPLKATVGESAGEEPTVIDFEL
ncbi:MAG: hypothetical protein WDZ51_17630 [Pirellulaceae bacterium]